MPKNRNYASDDQLAIFENRLRSSGVWCDASVNASLVHKFICRNPKATVAISLCASQIVPMEKLHENTFTKKCLVCALYDEGESEVQNKLERSLVTIVDKVTEN